MNPGPSTLEADVLTTEPGRPSQPQTTTQHPPTARRRRKDVSHCTALGNQPPVQAGGSEITASSHLPCPPPPPLPTSPLLFHPRQYMGDGGLELKYVPPQDLHTGVPVQTTHRYMAARHKDLRLEGTAIGSVYLVTTDRARHRPMSLRDGSADTTVRAVTLTQGAHQTCTPIQPEHADILLTPSC